MSPRRATALPGRHGDRPGGGPSRHHEQDVGAGHEPAADTAGQQPIPAARRAGETGILTRHADAADVGYIRGGGGVAVDTRRAASAVAAVCSAALVLLILVLTRSAVDQVSSARTLASHGVAVDTTVTSCLGLASGTGITTVGSTCRVTFSLGGHRYAEVLHGSTASHEPGDVVAAVVVPGAPSTVTTATSAHHAPSLWRVTTAPLVLLFIEVALVVVWRGRRARR